MKAAVLYQTNQPLVIEDVQIDPPKANEVKVKIAVAGVCRSDLHFMKGEAIIPMPAVLGHEGSAIVMEIGDGVTNVAPGDHVILSFAPYCDTVNPASTAIRMPAIATNEPAVSSSTGRVVSTSTARTSARWASSAASVKKPPCLRLAYRR
jgi:Zn-dependent alcohol dehydrogenase